MKTILIASVISATMLLMGKAQAEDPNPEVAQAVQAIAARRAEKEDARAKQLAAWAKGEARERGLVSGAGNVFTINLGEGAGAIGAPGQVQVILNEDEDND